VARASSVQALRDEAGNEIQAHLQRIVGLGFLCSTLCLASSSKCTDWRVTRPGNGIPPRIPFKQCLPPLCSYGASVLAKLMSSESTSCLSSHHTREPIQHRTSYELLPLASESIECRRQGPNPLPCSREHTTGIPQPRTIKSLLTTTSCRGYFLRSLSRQRFHHHLRDLRLHPRGRGRRM
jgi:hypothetical protein